MAGGAFPPACKPLRIMNEDFVTYELAVKLKEKGFNEPCYGYYHRGGGDDSFELCGNGDCDFQNSKNKYRIATPTIPQVLKWLRKEKKIHIQILFTCPPNKWEYITIKMTNNELRGTCATFTSYEQAALAGIKYILGNLI